MIYRLLADAVTLLHLAFVVFVVLGGLLAFRWRRLIWVHVPAALWGAWIELSHRICPLTPLEIRLRQLGGEAGYEGGFVERYILPVLYPRELSTDVQLLLGLAVILINLMVYLLLWRHGRRKAPR